MRDDDVLERQLEQCAERRQHAILVPWRSPDPQLAGSLGQRVGEHERPLFGHPQGRLGAPAPVVQRLEPARQPRTRLQPVELGLRDVVAPEQVWAECPGAVAPDEDVDVADMIRLQDDGERRRARVQALPHLGCRLGGRDRVDHSDLAP